MTRAVAGAAPGIWNQPGHCPPFATRTLRVMRTFARYFAEQGRESVCSSVVRAAELRYGAEKRDSTALRTRTER
jgi:hypothetical protein